MGPIYSCFALMAPAMLVGLQEIHDSSADADVESFIVLFGCIKDRSGRQTAPVVSDVHADSLRDEMTLLVQSDTKYCILFFFITLLL